jgi:hypothetical protein
MPVLLRPSLLTSQPQGTVALNRANPLTVGLGNLWVATSLADVATGLLPLSIGSSTTFDIRGDKTGGAMRALVSTASTSSTFGLQYPLGIPLTGNFTLFAYSKLDFNTFLTSCAIANDYTGSVGTTAIIKSSGTYHPRGYVTNSAGTVVQANSATTLPTALILQTLVYNGSNILFYENGVQVASASVTSIKQYASQKFLVGHGASATIAGYMGMCGAFSRALAPAEIASLAANPWQLLKSTNPVISALTTAAGATNYSLTCSAGAYAYTGVAAGLKVAHTLTCSAGAYAYIGVAAGLKVAHMLTCSAGAYAYTGVAAGLKVAHVLTCSAGSYAYTGVAATLNYGAGSVSYSLTCSAGAYSLTGVASTLHRAVMLPASAGSYVVTGVSGGLQVSRSMPCASGAYTLTGTAGALGVSHTLTCATGTYTHTGVAATLIYSGGAASYALTCSPGSYTYSGIASLQPITRVMPCSAGGYTVTGGTVSFIRGINLLCEAGAYSLTGGAATLTAFQGAAVYALTCSPGSYVLTGGAGILQYLASGKIIADQLHCVKRLDTDVMIRTARHYQLIQS